MTDPNISLEAISHYPFTERLRTLKKSSLLIPNGISLTSFLGRDCEINSFILQRVGNDRNFPYTEQFANPQDIYDWVRLQPYDTTRLSFKIHLPQSDQLFDGLTMWHHIDPFDLTASRGLVIFNPVYRGLGYGSIIGSAMIEIAKALGLKRVQARTKIGNIVSYKNLRKQFGEGIQNGDYFEFDLDLLSASIPKIISQMILV